MYMKVFITLIIVLNTAVVQQTVADGISSFNGPPVPANETTPTSTSKPAPIILADAALANLDEIPALSIPESSEEISNDPAPLPPADSWSTSPGHTLNPKPNQNRSPSLNAGPNPSPTLGPRPSPSSSPRPVPSPSPNLSTRPSLKSSPSPRSNSSLNPINFNVSTHPVKPSSTPPPLPGLQLKFRLKPNGKKLPIPQKGTFSALLAQARGPVDNAISPKATLPKVSLSNATPPRVPLSKVPLFNATPPRAPLSNVSWSPVFRTSPKPVPTSEVSIKPVPSPVRSPRVTVLGYTGKAVHTFNLTENQILYHIRIFWIEPVDWRDRAFKPPQRLYNLFCWLSNDGSWVRDLIRQNFSAHIFSHSQWFPFPDVEQEPEANFTFDCGVRAVNSGGLAGDWSFSDPVLIKQSPIFLRGFDNINVLGWSKEEVSHLVKTSQLEGTRRDSPVKNAGLGKARENRKC